MVIALIIIGVLTRLIPHVPNLSCAVAIALFGGVYLNKKHSYLIPLAIFILSDIALGLHATVFFTWSAIVLIYFVGRILRQHKTALNILKYTVASSVLFYVITNFGVWTLGWYSYTPEGLLNCFVRAIPFFRTSLAGNLLYVAVLFGTYEYLLHRKNMPRVSKATA